MRRITLFPLTLALLLASLMAPYQHVHLRTSRNARPDHDDDDADAAIVHIHFYAVSLPPGAGARPNLAGPGDDHIAQALDTFTAVAQSGLPALALPPSQGWLFTPWESHEQFVERVEARGHDPPVLRFSIPRAPPA